jgi:hypothetical protein
VDPNAERIGSRRLVTLTRLERFVGEVGRLIRKGDAAERQDREA